MALKTFTATRAPAVGDGKWLKSWHLSQGITTALVANFCEDSAANPIFQVQLPINSSLSPSYATGGDTIPFVILGIGNRVSFISPPGVTTPGGHVVELIPGATEYVAPKLRVRDVATGVELTAASNNSAQSVTVEAF